MKHPILIALTLVLAALPCLVFGQQVANPPTARPYVGGLPDAGLNYCYDDQGQVTDCETAECPGRDGFYHTGCAPRPGVRFINNGDSTVTDLCTGLMWRQNTEDVNGDLKIDGNDFLIWCDALRYSDSLVYAGYDDWRLPNVRELESIVHYGRSDPAIAPVFGAEPMSYWTSTTFLGDPGLKWAVNFSAGLGLLIDGIDGECSIRAVRGGL